MPKPWLVVLVLTACDPMPPTSSEPASSEAPPLPEAALANAPEAVARRPEPSPLEASACERAVNRYRELAAAEGTQMTSSELSAEIEKCHQERWNADLLACVTEADSTDAIARECYKLAFGDGAVAVQVKRSKDVLRLAKGEQSLDCDVPPFGSRAGDALTFRHDGKSCGVVMAEAKPALAAFIVCEGEVLAGPITHKSEIARATQMIGDAIASDIIGRARRSRAGADLASSVRRAWPSGGRGYTVIDRSTGAPLYSTY